MLLSRLIQGAALKDHIGRDVEITSLTCDSRAVSPGGLFAAFPGTRHDGTEYIQEALERGAAAVLCPAPPSFPGPWLTAADARGAFGQLCANWFGRPGDGMTLVGVTGTNGKTTTACLLKWVLERTLGARVGLIGTNGTFIRGERLPAGRTTPDAYTLHSLLARMRQAGCTHGVMEVSSHGLALRRTAGLTFRAGVFTNLTRDHLDFHGTMEDYRAAKGRLFSQCEAAVINGDDPAGRCYARCAPCRCHTYGIGGGEVRGSELRLSPGGVSFRASAPEGDAWVELPLPGRFNVYNALGVLACCRELGVPLERAAAALAQAPGVPGRAERVEVPAPYTVLLDYAHTPDALENILRAVREGTEGRLLCLFGCGGDRDRTKRPLMGEIGTRLADRVVLTSDNPRTEDPETILDEIAAGIPPERAGRVLRETDRRRAIRRILAMAQAGDTVLLAGKGHEKTQEIGGKRIPLDERKEITSFFAESAL